MYYHVWSVFRKDSVYAIFIRYVSLRQVCRDDIIVAS